MAIALAQTIEAGVTTGNIVLPSWTPGSNELVLIAIVQRNETITPTLSGNGLTFVSVIDVEDNQGQVGVHVFRALGASPSTGAITVTLTANVTPAYAIAARFSGVDTSGTNGSGAIEVTASATTGAVDNNDITVNITTLTNGAWAYGAVGVHGGTTLTLVDETTIDINNLVGSGGDIITAHAFYQVVATAGATTLLGANSYSADREWAIAAISIKPASTGSPYNQNVSGSITATGTLLKQVSKKLAGSITPNGTLSATLVAATITTASSLRQRLRGARYSQDELSFSISSPAWSFTNFREDYTQEVTSYEHSHAATGGFWSATLGLRLPFTEIEDWLENGIGRQIQTKGMGTFIAWEGIVNRITLSVGGYNMTVGPYLDIANKVKLTYSMYLSLGGANATGIRVVTGYMSDLDSQAKYGILEKNFSVGNIDESAIGNLQTMLLDRYHKPNKSEDLNLPGDVIQTFFDIKLECIGYAQLFQKYLYSNATLSVQNLSDKLTAIINAEPNGLFTSSIEENTLQVPTAEQDDPEAWGLIKSLLALGNSSLDRCNFGVYENRRVIYKAVTNEVSYVRPLREGSSIIQNAYGSLLKPWEIRPGGHILIADLLPGITRETNLIDERHALFANTVQYRMPDSLIINGAHSFRIEQKLAQLGLSGVS